MESSGELCLAQYQFVSNGSELQIFKKAIDPHDIIGNLGENILVSDFLQPTEIEYFERK